MNSLEEWSKHHNALERTEELFWSCFQSYKEEEPEEFSEVFPKGKANVKIEFERIVHEVLLPDYDQEFISVYLNIYVDDHNVGWFKNILLIDGTDFDEFFVIEQFLEPVQKRFASKPYALQQQKTLSYRLYTLYSKNPEHRQNEEKSENKASRLYFQFKFCAYGTKLGLVKGWS